MLQRRKFIRYLSSFLAGSYFFQGCHLDKVGREDDDVVYAASELPTPNKKEKIVVIGAGMAGLTAGRLLKDQGHQVILLEARHRLGGRIFTDRSWDIGPVDLGASWIHTSQGNPLYELAQNHKIDGVPTDYENKIIYNQSGQVYAKEQRDDLEDLYEGVMAILEKKRSARIKQGLPDLSLNEALQAELPNLKLSNTQLQELIFGFNVEIEHDYAADIADLSFYNYDQDEEFDGDDILMTKGYDQIIHALAEDLDVHLQEIVNRIEMNSNSVSILTNLEKYQADRVIITLPLGVLKAGNVEFSPPLPQAKIQAIRNLDMGTLNKVAFRFSKVFWDPNLDFYNYISESKGQWAAWLNFAKFNNTPILMGFNAGDFGKAIEAKSDAEIVASGLEVLKVIFGSKVPAPEQTLITRWSSDPFALGSYSYLPKGASGLDYAAMAQSVNSRLFFAGEHCYGTIPSTVHGAYISAIEAVRELTELLIS